MASQVTVRPLEGDGPVGQRIAGRYVVEALIGRGGMGAVYRVFDEVREEPVALKRLHDKAAANASVATLFQREYHTLAQLRHPRVIQVHDYGVDEEGPYYTMELLDGRDFRKLAPLPWRQACRLIRDVASSLAILHSRRLLHRDVSARNVRCTEDGRAKLIDFGALITMGVPAKVIGTPPYVAPEVLQRQPLDQRSDLFSLGALAYWLITGRHAYPARRIRELIDVWRTQPGVPSGMVKDDDIPRGLDELIMSLLSLSSMARPRSAGEVIDRLNAVAELEPLHDVQAVQAYLSTPALTGRDQEMLLFRKQMIQALRGQGGTWMVEGIAGVGRSRLLQGFCLEAKLAGATVLHAGAADGAQGPYGAVRALASDLLDALPEVAVENARPHLALLGHVIPELADADGSSSMSLHQDFDLEQQRPRIQTALVNWFLALSTRRCLMLAVDDLQAIDEPSAAVLMGVSQMLHNRKLVIAVTTLTGVTPTAPKVMRVLARSSMTLALGGLDPSGTERLLRSVFGDVPNVKLVSDRIHAASAGNPAATMHLAQHLVDTKVVRFAAGGWSLPAALRHEDLPSSLQETLQARVRALGEDARTLAEMLALCPEDNLSPDGYLQLTDHHDPARLYPALDELVAMQVLSLDGERYRFAQRGWIPVLLEGTNEQQERETHLKLAAIFDGHGDTVRTAHHLLRGGADDRGVTALLAQIEKAPDKIYEALGAEGVESLEQAASHAERQERPARDRYLLGRTLVNLAAIHDPNLFIRYGEPVLEQLRHASGQIYWDEAPSGLSVDERVAHCLERAQKRYEALSPPERVLQPREALAELASTVLNASRAAVMLYEVTRMDDLEAIVEPFAGCSPALEFARDVVVVGKYAVWGNLDWARAMYLRLIERLEETDGAGLTPQQREFTRHNLMYALGVAEAGMGLMSAMHWAAQLDADPLHQVNAWRIRRIAHVKQGNSGQAEECRHRVEMLAIQNSPRQSYEGITLIGDLVAHATAGDLMGVKECLEQIVPMAERYRGWRPWLHAARADYHRLRGDYPAARSDYERALDLVAPARHTCWWVAAIGYVSTLRQQGASELAYARARRFVQLAGREGSYYRHLLGLEVALCEAQKREFTAAVERVDAIVHEANEWGVTGLNLGILFEQRARIALWMDDQRSFEQHAKLTADQYRRGENPILTARYEKLLEEARQRNFVLPSAVRHAAEHTREACRKARDALDECAGLEELSHTALDLLLERTEGRGGYLYLVADGELRLAATRAPREPPEALKNELLEAVRRVHAEDHNASLDPDTPTPFSDGVTESFVEEGTPHQDGTVQSILLTTLVHREALVVAAAAVFHAQPTAKPVGYDFCRTIAEVLYRAGATRK